MGKLDTGTNSAGWGVATTGTGEIPEWCKDWGKDATAFCAATLDDWPWFSPGCAGKPPPGTLGVTLPVASTTVGTATTCKVPDVLWELDWLPPGCAGWPIMESGETSATWCRCWVAASWCSLGNILESPFGYSKIPTRNFGGNPTSRLYDSWDSNHLQSVWYLRVIWGQQWTSWIGVLDGSGWQWMGPHSDLQTHIAYPKFGMKN